MFISIIIPNYNGKPLLEKNLPKVISEAMKQPALPAGRCNSETMEIIIVDDGSTDGSVEYLKTQMSKLKTTTKNLNLKLLKNKKNLGFASAVNRGVNEARGEVVVLLNTDVHPEEGFLKAVLPHFKNPKVFAVGMMDKSLEDGKIVRRGRGVGWWGQGFYKHRRGKVDKTDTAWVSGGSGVFGKPIWEKLGGFDEIFNPFYWEDIDLSFRAQKAGYKILFEPKSIVIHEHEKGVIKSNYDSHFVKTISYRNQFLFVWKNADWTQLILHFLWLPYHIIRSIISGETCFFTGFLWAIKRRLTY